jgi:hypothetical protein
MALVERWQAHSQELAQRGAPLPAAAAAPGEAQHAPPHAAPHRTCISLVQSRARARNVGILAMEVYFSAVYVRPGCKSGRCRGADVRGASVARQTPAHPAPCRAGVHALEAACRCLIYG